MIGGITARLDAMLAEDADDEEDTEIGCRSASAYMREGAMLSARRTTRCSSATSSPAFAGALITKVKLVERRRLLAVPAWVYQSGTMDSHKAVQIPMSLILKLGELVKVSADLGIFTGDDYSFSGDKGGRIAAGGCARP